MQVRLTSITFSPGKVDQAKKIYNDEIAPAVRKQKGNLDCRLLEPENKSDEYISMTMWKTKGDADAYQSSGTYKKMVDKVRPFFSKDPVLKVYATENVKQTASAMN